MIVWLASYPRSGNTFFRVILNSIFKIHTYSIYNDNDIGSDKETSAVVGHNVLPNNFNLTDARKSKETYYIKTHEHFDSRVKPDDKVVYLIRDGRESTLSFTKHQNIYGKKNKTLLDTIYGNTWIGSWGEHVKSWEKFPTKNILYIHFEALTDKPLDQISKISNFLTVTAIDTKLPTFDELKAINPKFFRTGKKNSWKDAYTEEEHIAFWYKHFEPMKKYGYTNAIPEIFQNTQIVSLYKAIETDYLYKKENIFSQINNDYEKKINTLKLNLENTTRTSCMQTKKSEALEKKIITINKLLEQLTQIKFSSHPIQKYHAYKKMITTYNRSTKHPYILEKTFLLPTDNPHEYPNKHFCILEKEHPILIYQVGKVGSSAIYESLKKQINTLPIYQIHNVATAQALLNEDLKMNNKQSSAHFTMGITLQKILQKETNIKWKIIIGVREPIARWISDVFENIHTRYKFLKNSDNNVNVEKTIQFIKDTLNSEPQEKWFQDEFQATFGINLFNTPFSGNSQITQEGNLNILLYKFENMQQYIPSAIQGFLNLKDFNLLKANVSSQKSTATAYEEVKQKLRLEADFLNKFYAKPVVKHFYTDKEIETFKKQWIKA